MKLRILFSIVLLAALAGNAKAWGCADGTPRVPEGTTQPSGTAGNGPNQWFLGTGTEGTKGVYYVCDPSSPTPSSSTQSQNQNQSQSQSQTSNSSASNTLKNRVTATGGNSSSTATGGTSSLKNSGNSTIENSGNSSNSNKNTAQGGAGGQGGSASSASNSNSSAQNNGNGSNNTSYSSETNVAATKIPVDTAYAPTTLPTVPCFKTYSGGAQTSAFGISLGGGKIDENCARLETARSFDAAGETLAACKVKISNKYAKEAGVTLEDCLVKEKKIVVIPAPAPAPVAAPPVVVVVPTQVPAPQPEPTPVVTATVPQSRTFPTCAVPNGVVTNVCKAELRDVARVMLGNSDARLHIAAPQSSVKQIKAFLSANGVRHGVEWGVFDDQNDNLTMFVTWTDTVK